MAWPWIAIGLAGLAAMGDGPFVTQYVSMGYVAHQYRQKEHYAHSYNPRGIVCYA